MKSSQEEQVVLKHKRRSKLISVPRSRWEKNQAAYQEDGYHLATKDQIEKVLEVEAIIPQETTEQEKGD